MRNSQPPEMSDAQLAGVVLALVAGLLLGACVVFALSEIGRLINV